MKICKNCKHVQETGNFCGECGAQVENQSIEDIDKMDMNSDVGEVHLETVATQEIPSPINEGQTNEQIEKVKEQSKKYVNYFFEQLKSPSKVVAKNQSSLNNGLISIALYTLISAIAVYTSLQVFFGGYNSFFDTVSPSLFEIIFYMGILFILLIGINILAISVTSNLFSVNQRVKEILDQIGRYYAVPVVFSIIGLFLAILKSLTLASAFIYIGGLIAFGVIPLFIMLKLLNTKSKSVDSFYALLFYLVVTAVAIFLLGLFIADSVIGEFLRYL